MFENVEKKLKTYATVNFVGVIIVALSLLFTGAVEFGDASGGAVLVLLLAYALIVYCLLASCWFIQAFAEITESVKRTNEILQIAFADNIAEAKVKAKKDAEKQAEAERILAEEERALEEEKAERHKAYWAEHADERATLLAKKREAEKALKSVGSLAGKERAQLQKLIDIIDEELNKER